MSSLIIDLRAAWRFFRRRRPAFLISVITMALALGANTAIFSVLKSFVFANLGVASPEKIAFLWTTKDVPGQGSVNFFGSYPNYARLRDATTAFAATAATINVDLNWEEGNQTTRLAGSRVSHEFIAVMGLTLPHGRGFLLEEQGPGAAPSAIISDRLWHRGFNADPAVIGRTLRLNGNTVTIIGVMPPRFEQPFNTEIWLPFDLPETQWHHINGGRQLTLFGRLADGVSFADANRELAHFAKVNASADPANKDWGWLAQPLQDTVLAGADHALLLVQAGAVILLLLATTNLVALMLAWAGERTRENALRLALGATFWQLTRQYLVQSLILVACGGIVGIALAYYSLPILQHLNPNPAISSLLHDLQLDRTTLGFAALLVLGVGLLAGIAPAWQARGASIDSALRAGGRSASASPAALHWQRRMVVAQSTISIVILVIAGLAGLGFQQLAVVDLGFDPDDRVAFRLEFPTPSHETHEQRTQFVRELEANLACEPILLNYGFTSTIPVGDVLWGGGFYPQLLDGTYPEDLQSFHYRRVSPSYPSVLGVPLIEGRWLDQHDVDPDHPVALVSQSLAEKFWPGASALGRVMRPSTPDNAPFVEIVGVVSDVRDAGAGFPESSTVYVPFAQQSLRRGWVVLHGRGSTTDTLNAGLRALRQTTSQIAPIDINSLDTLVWQSYALPRLQIVLLGVFAAIALLMSVLGTYGVMSQLVANRRRDLAIRAALGATRSEVLRHVLFTNAKLALTGIALGSVAAWFAARSVEASLTGFEAGAVTPYVSAGLVLTAATQLSSWIPARRAAHADISQVLSGD